METFQPFPKIKRLDREIVITEKIDGSNASIFIYQVSPENEDVEGSIATIGSWDSGFFRLLAASRSRWITTKDDNYGFAKWVEAHKEDLFKLGPGHHFGEWWGKGIQRGYNQIQKRFSLFNVTKWRDSEVRPKCCDVVPVLYEGAFTMAAVNQALETLKAEGSFAAKGYPYPEGICIYHTHGNWIMKKTIDNDDEHKNKKEKTPICGASPVTST